VITPSDTQKTPITSLKRPRVRSAVPPSNIETRRQYDQTHNESENDSGSEGPQKVRKILDDRVRTPDCPRSKFSNDPFADMAWKTIVLPSSIPETDWILVSDPIVSKPLQFHYREVEKESFVEIFFRLREPNVTYTIEVIASIDERTIVSLRVFRMTTIKYSGLVLDAMIRFFKREHAELTTLIYPIYPKENDHPVREYLNYLSNKTSRWIRKGQEYIYSLK
jgi:hypothetical protein